MSIQLKLLAYRIAVVWGFKIQELNEDRIIFSSSTETYEIHKFKDYWCCVKFNDDKLGWEAKQGEYVFSPTLRGLLRDGLKTYKSPFEAWTAMGLVN